MQRRLVRGRQYEFGLVQHETMVDPCVLCMYALWLDQDGLKKLEGNTPVIR